MVHSRGSNAVLEKSNWATGQTLTPIGLERVFQRSTQVVDSPLAAKMSKSPPRRPEATYSIGNARSADNDVEGLPYTEQNPLRLPINSREASIAFVDCVVDVCS